LLNIILGSFFTSPPAPQYVTTGTNVAPLALTYPWSATGFGTKYSDPASAPAGTPTNARFYPGATAVAYSMGTSPYINLYA